MPCIVHADQNRKNRGLEIDCVRLDPCVEVDYPVPRDASVQERHAVCWTCRQHLTTDEERVPLSEAHSSPSYDSDIWHTEYTGTRFAGDGMAIATAKQVWNCISAADDTEASHPAKIRVVLPAAPCVRDAVPLEKHRVSRRDGHRAGSWCRFLAPDATSKQDAHRLPPGDEA